MKPTQLLLTLIITTIAICSITAALQTPQSNQNDDPDYPISDYMAIDHDPYIPSVSDTDYPDYPKNNYIIIAEYPLPENKSFYREPIPPLPKDEKDNDKYYIQPDDIHEPDVPYYFNQSEDKLYPKPKNPHFMRILPELSTTYTKTFIKNQKTNKYPSIKFEGYYYFLPYDGKPGNNPFLKYIELNTQYLLKHPKSKVLQKEYYVGYYRILAESYTDRDPNQIYPGDKLIASQYNKNTNITTTVYIHTDNIKPHLLQKTHWVYIFNNDLYYPEINPMYGPNNIYQYAKPTILQRYHVEELLTIDFLQSNHFKDNIVTHETQLYYTKKPDLKTVLDYILAKKHQITGRNTLTVRIDLEGYRECKGFLQLLDTEDIAYSQKIDPTENPPLKKPTSEQIIKNLNTLPKQLLIEKKTIDNETTIGFFIDIEKIIKIKPEIPKRQFTFIGTLVVDEEAPFFHKKTVWYNQVWGDEINPYK